MAISKVAVLGAGTMGRDIAAVVAAAGVDVVVKDIDGSYEPFADADLVIEAVPETLDVKRAVFAELDAATPAHAILASNTSSLPITEMAAATKRPQQVVGFHFFYPARVSPLIEVIAGEQTATDTVETAIAFAEAIGKVPIRCADRPGFVVNRILTAAVSEAWREQEESGTLPREVDDAVAAARVAPLGPFRLADVIGLDIVLHVAEHLRDTLGERFHVHQGMRELVAAGELGVKTGSGFYDYAG
jgi:3-hydroxyacyl-CoA dehydrogenase